VQSHTITREGSICALKLPRPQWQAPSICIV